jgi:Carbohydrate binding module (family 6)
MSTRKMVAATCLLFVLTVAACAPDGQDATWDRTGAASNGGPVGVAARNPRGEPDAGRDAGTHDGGEAGEPSATTPPSDGGATSVLPRDAASAPLDAATILPDAAVTATPPVTPEPPAATPPDSGTPAAPQSITLQAESYSGEQGTIDGGTVIGGCDGGDWLRYDGVDLGSGFATFVARGNVPTGGTLRVRIDTLSGPILGSLSTGSPTETTQDFVATLDPTLSHGKHDIYITFVGSGVGNFDSFSFVN